MTAIFVDAPADLSPQLARKLDIQVLPVRLVFKGGEILSDSLHPNDLLVDGQAYECRYSFD